LKAFLFPLPWWILRPGYFIVARAFIACTWALSSSGHAARGSSSQESLHNCSASKISTGIACMPAFCIAPRINDVLPVQSGVVENLPGVIELHACLRSTLKEQIMVVQATIATFQLGVLALEIAAACCLPKPLPCLTTLFCSVPSESVGVHGQNTKGIRASARTVQAGLFKERVKVLSYHIAARGITRQAPATEPDLDSVFSGAQEKWSTLIRQVQT